MGATSLICKKSYATPVPPTAYWTLDEAAPSVDRVDSVLGLALAPTAATNAGVPGIIGNGVNFTGAAFGDYSVGAFLGAPLAHLAANGLSFWGWAKINSLGAPSLGGGPAAVYIIGPFKIGISVGSNTDPQDCRIFSDSDVAYVAITLAAWHFFVLSWNPLLSKWGYSIDNGAVVYLPTVVAMTDQASGDVQLLTGAGADVIFDEIGILTTAMLTPARQTYLYNGGAGRTWPLSLP